MMNYRELWQRLLTVYDEGEAKAVVTWLMDVGFHLSLADLLGGALERLTVEEQRQLEQMMKRLEQGEPVQYVTGRTEFCGHWFHVAPGVLIPRPETEELCQWIISDAHCSEHHTILDIGTGSGCIAVTLALDMQDSQVTAWDISQEALHIASENAQKLGAGICLVQQDALRPPQDTCCWDVIVSNPPYVCYSERLQMHNSVLDHEPHQALFVPDDDPLLFYRAIGQYASKALRNGSSLYFEINPRHHEQLCWLLEQQGFKDITTKNDQYGKCRMVKATRP